MFNPIDYAKKHPVMTGAVVIGGGVVFLAITGVFGGGGSTTTISNAKDPATLAAETQIALATLSSNTQLGAARIALEANTGDLSLQKYLAEMAASIESKRIDSESALGLKTIEASLQLGQSSTNAELEALRIQASAATTISTNEASQSNNLMNTILAALTTDKTTGGSDAASGGVPDSYAAPNTGNPNFIALVAQNQDLYKDAYQDYLNRGDTVFDNTDLQNYGSSFWAKWGTSDGVSTGGHVLTYS